MGKIIRAVRGIAQVRLLWSRRRLAMDAQPSVAGFRAVAANFDQVLGAGVCREGDP
jgi:hypothetical protein